jgi:hypothetical protein
VELLTFSLAHETGWSYDYIRRRAPLAMLLRIYHAALWSNGAWTVRKKKVDIKELFTTRVETDEDGLDDI